MFSLVLFSILLKISSITGASALYKNSSTNNIEHTDFNKQVVELATKLSTSRSIQEMVNDIQTYADNSRVVSEAVFLFEIYNKNLPNEEKDNLYQAKKIYLEQQGFYDFSLRYKVFYTINPRLFNLFLGILFFFLFLILFFVKKKLKKN